MPDEMGAVAQQLDDVVGIDEEVFPGCERALTVPAPIEHREAKSLLGQRALGLPFLGPGRQRAVHEHDRLTGAPHFDVQIAGAGVVHLRHGGPCINGHRRSFRSRRRNGDDARKAWAQTPRCGVVLT